MTMTTATARKAAHVLIIGKPDCDDDLRHWLDTHAHCEHVNSFEEALDALRNEPFDLVLSGAAELLPTPSIPLNRPATTILDIIRQGICIVRASGEIEWANARLMALPAELREQVRERCLRVTRSTAAGSAAATPRARRFTVNAAGETFKITVTPILDRHHRVAQAAAIVGPAASRRTKEGWQAAIDHAGRELLNLDVQQFSRLEPQERLSLLEQKILRYMQDVLHFDTFEIRVLEPSSNKLELVMCAGLPAEGATANELFACAEGSGITGYVAATGHSYVCPDVSKDRRYLPGLSQARSSLTVPMWLGDTLMGVANFESTRPTAFTDEDRQGAETFARYIALALHMLELMASERQTSTKRVGRTVLGEVTAPLNDIQADVDAILAESGKDPLVRDRLRSIVAGVSRVRDSVQQFSAAKPGVIGAQSASTRRTDPILEGRRVLLADDEEMLRETVRDVLTGYGCTVCTAADGAAAIDLIGKEPFDLVLSDIKMPVRSGYEVFAAAKQANPCTPVILTTGFGYDPNHSIIRARREGLAAVLLKPFKVDQLLGEIRTAIKSAAK
jgi:CheY-like chemotaxis protein